MPESLRIIDNLGYALRPDIFHTELLDVVRKDWKENYRNPAMDPRVERAILTVPRHRFTSNYPFSEIYKKTILDHEGHSDSTASEPGLVAYMTQLVLPDKQAQDTIALDIGCGLGYQTAMLQAVGFSRVIGVEIKPDIAQKAQRIFKDNPGVAIIQGDGKTAGGDLKFDAIVVAAQATNLDHVRKLRKYLKIGGKMIIPISVAALAEELAREDPELTKQAEGIGVKNLSVLTLFTKTGRNKFREDPQTIVRFVDLV